MVNHPDLSGDEDESHDHEDEDDVSTPSAKRVRVDQVNPQPIALPPPAPPAAPNAAPEQSAEKSDKQKKGKVQITMREYETISSLLALHLKRLVSVLMSFCIKHSCLVWLGVYSAGVYVE